MNRILTILVVLSCLYTLYDIWFLNKSLTREWKWIWTIVALLFSVVAAGVYFTMVKKRD